MGRLRDTTHTPRLHQHIVDGGTDRRSIKDSNNRCQDRSTDTGTIEYSDE
jgi:hypothetical protein